MKRLIAMLAAVSVMIGGMFLFLNHRADAKKTQSESDKLRVVTTNSILEDMVNQVGGDRVEVYSIVKRGTDPHEYEPKPSDISAATEADILFHNGLNLETGGSGWFKKLVETSHKAFEKDVFAASEGIKPLHLTTNVDEMDPHAWLDLANGQQYVLTIAKRLGEKDPKNANYYMANAEAYNSKLEKLHKQAQAKFKSIPEKQRVLVTSEGAFKYFGEAYAVTPVYIWEINTESQGTPEQMQEVLTKIDQADVRHLFVETSVSSKSMEKVAHETGKSIYSKLFTDSLAAKGTQGDTYYTMMEWNINHIYDGLTNSWDFAPTKN